MTAFATAALADTLGAGFPACLHDAPMLLPGEDFAIHQRLLRWLERADVGGGHYAAGAPTEGSRHSRERREGEDHR